MFSSYAREGPAGEAPRNKPGAARAPIYFFVVTRVTVKISLGRI